MRNRLKLKRLRIKVAKAQDKRVAELKETFAAHLDRERITMAGMQGRILELEHALNHAVAERDATIARQDQQLATMRAALDGTRS